MRLYVENDATRVRVVGSKAEITKALKAALKAIGADDAHRIDCDSAHVTFEAYPAWTVRA